VRQYRSSQAKSSKRLAYYRTLLSQASKILAASIDAFIGVRFRMAAAGKVK
jgi:hypothetical protein